MPQSEERNEEREQVKGTLHPLLRSTFDLLLEDYEVSATIHAGEGSVNYNIIADLVRAGVAPCVALVVHAPSIAAAPGARISSFLTSD
jgi:hypothetical protein